MPRLVVTLLILLMVASYGFAQEDDSTLVDSAETTVVEEADTISVDTNESAFTSTRTLIYDVGKQDISAFVGRVSRSGLNVAIVLAGPTKQFVQWQGVDSKKYDRMADVFISPDGNHMAHFGWTDKKYYAVVDGVDIGTYADVYDSVCFSPDGQHHFFTAQKKGRKTVAVVDGVERKHDNILTPMPMNFSPDSRHSVYMARKGKKCFAVVDGADGEKYDITGIGPIFSSDSKKMAYTGTRNDSVYVVINGVEEGGYTRVTEFVFSPDGAEYAYAPMLNYDHYVVRGQDTLGPYVNATHLTYSEDGEHFAFVARRDTTHFVVFDGTEREVFTDVSWPVLSPVGGRMAYVAFMGNLSDTVHEGQAVVLDGAQQSKYPYVYLESLAFSPDGRRFCYLAELDTLQVIAVVDGVPSEAYRDIYEVLFSPDSKSFAFLAQVSDSLWCVVRDGVEIDRFQQIGEFSFSPDGAHIAYVVYGGDGLLHVAVDGQQFEGYYNIKPMKPVFDEVNQLHYFGRVKHKEIYQVTVVPTSKDTLNSPE